MEYLEASFASLFTLTREAKECHIKVKYCCIWLVEVDIVKVSLKSSFERLNESSGIVVAYNSPSRNFDLLTVVPLAMDRLKSYKSQHISMIFVSWSLVVKLHVVS